MEENIISQSFSNVTLTDKRVVFDGRKSGGNDYLAIPLDAVAHCKIEFRSSPKWIWGAIVLLIAAAGLGRIHQEVALFSAACSVVSLIAYFASRTLTLCIGASSGEEIRVSGLMGYDPAAAFLEKVQTARQSFIEKP